jgi:RND family efflux transporter MFP subunit
MSSSSRRWILPLVSALVSLGVGLAGCGSEQAEITEHLRPVRWEQVFQTGGGRTRIFAGVTRAGQEIELSFKVGGTVEKLAVSVGARVAAGDLIATIDDRDYRLETEEAEAALRRVEAELRNARSSYQRAEALYEANNASLSELDAARAGFETAQASVRSAEKNLQLARRRLGYTSLTAPVAGAIARRSVEENENVQVGQEVALLTAGSRAEVEIFLPGQLIGQLAVGDAATVTVSALPGQTFAALVTEVGVAATGGGNTFPVIVRLEDEHQEVLSGMAAEVSLVFGGRDQESRFLVPASAVGQDDHGRYAFVVREIADGVGVATRVTVTTG